MKKLSMMLLVFFIFGLSTAGYTSEGCLLFNDTFKRSTKTSATNILSVKSSETKIRKFKAVDGGAIVKVYNGAQEDEAQKVSSATIVINGEKVIGPSNFNQNTDYIEKMVEVSEDNSLEVLLKSKPGGKIKVVILQPAGFALSASDGRGAASVCSEDSTYPDKVLDDIIVQYGQLKGLAVSPDGKYLYVTDAFDATVKIIEISSKSVIYTVPVRTDTNGDILSYVNPHRVAVAADLSLDPDLLKVYHVYVSNQYDDSVSVIDSSNQSVVTIPDPDIKSPYGIAATFDGKYVYVCNSDNNTVSVIRASDNSVTATIPIEGKPRAVATTRDGRVYVCNSNNNTVSVILTSDNKSVAKKYYVGTAHPDIGVTPDGSFVYVSNPSDGSVSAINTGNNTVAKIYVGSYPSGIAVTPNGNFVYVSNKGDDTVSVIQTSNNSVINTIKGEGDLLVGDGPDGIAVSPDGAYVYVIATYEGKVSVIGH